jgi:hypothetical protein
LYALGKPTILAAAIKEDVGGVGGVLRNSYDVIVAATAAGAAKRASDAHSKILQIDVLRVVNEMRWLPVRQGAQTNVKILVWW